MQSTRRFAGRRRLCAVFCVVAAAACGDNTAGPPAGDDLAVEALNLSSGERRSFSSANEVPDGWAVCETDACHIPPQFPCRQLGGGACLLHPACRLRVRCEFDLDLGQSHLTPTEGPTPDGDLGHGTGGPAPEGESPLGHGTGGPAPEGEVGADVADACELVCVAKETLACGEIHDDQRCNARPDCEWDWQPAPCSHVSCPKSLVGYCRPSRKAPCQALDQAVCGRRPDCEWRPTVCTWACQDPAPCEGQDCPSTPPCESNCQSFCQPRQECPAIGHVIPDCEAGQKTEPQYDDKGCLTGYRCVDEGCPSVPAIAPLCPDGVPPELVYDERGCVVGSTCQSITCAAPLEPECDGHLIPEYDEHRCITRYICVERSKCDALATNYAAALRKAKVCQADSDNPCGLTVAGGLGCGHCPTYVNADSSAVNDLRRLQRDYQALNCGAEGPACAAIACLAPTGATCVAEATSGNTTLFTCQDDSAAGKQR